MRRSATLLAVLLLVPAAACGGNDDGDAPTEPAPTEDAAGPGTVAPDAYASDVCRAIDAWFDRINAASAALVEDAGAADQQDPAAGKARVVGFLDEAIGLTDGLVADLEGAGVPETGAGQETADRLVAGIGDVRTLFVDARDDTAALPTEDREVLDTGLEDIGASLQDSATAVGANFQEVLTSIEDPVLADAFETVGPCQELTTAG